MLRQLIFLLSILISLPGIGQMRVYGKVIGPDSLDYQHCKVGIEGTSIVLTPNQDGKFEINNLSLKKYVVQCYCLDFKPEKISIDARAEQEINFQLTKMVEEVAIVGYQKEINRAESPIVTDVYDKKFFAKNPSSSLLDIMDRMNGVRPQVNCNVCGTGDIHLNGLEGPYTLIVLDGVPIVGGLSSIYGLSGIPAFLLDRVEVTKGPASSIFGSEALAGVIHAYTKKPSKTPEFQMQHFSSTAQEFNSDFGLSVQLGKKTNYFFSANHYYFNHKIDANDDNFTDVPLQKRFSLFQRFNFERKSAKALYLSIRYFQENRWGGELNWNENFRGSDSLYAESIKIKRGEANLFYEFPTKEKISLLVHGNYHLQDSYYGVLSFQAKQAIFFKQLAWNKQVNRHHISAGTTIRNTLYDDNTFLTQSADSTKNKAMNSFLPGIYAEDSWKFGKDNTLLYSFRTDYHQDHGFIFTPRLAYLKKFNPSASFRIHAGSGFRIVNLFSEDHAALSGSRQVIISEKLKPEQSKSINTSFIKEKNYGEKWKLELDLQAFYTYFSNRIQPDYETNSQQIIYKNSNNYSHSYGGSVGLKIAYKNQLNAQLGLTRIQIENRENGKAVQQILSEKISVNWTISYRFKTLPLSIDFTGNLVGPMRLPLINDLDPRPQYSKTYSIQNIQFSYKMSDNCSFFLGLKNILNWTPAKGLPFLIARSHDPFDKKVSYDEQGNILASPENPYALSFDPAYVYAPNQGIRLFTGFRYLIKLKKADRSTNN